MNSSDTQAVILAAGTGSRLGRAAKGRPKCLIDVGGKPLIHHHLKALQAAGVDKVLIVVGHAAEQVIPAVCHAGALQFNEHFACTNSLYSLWITQRWVTGNLLLINSDVLADPAIYRLVAQAEGNVLAYDSGSGHAEEGMKVQFQSNRLQAISKTMPPSQSHGENLGILKFDRPGVTALFEEADRIIAQGGMNQWAPAAVDAMASRVPIRGLDVFDLPWTEIDFPEDLTRARREIWPDIRRRMPSASQTPRPASAPTPLHSTLDRQSALTHHTLLARLAS